jgi:hypothetical protein
MKKQILYLTIILGLGLLIGLITGFKINVDIENLIVDKNSIETFINTFTMNYWYLFLMSLLNNGTGVIVNLFILFGKGITLGTSFGILLKNKALFGLGVYLFNFLGQFIILVPMMYLIILSELDDTNKKLSVITVLLVIYSFIIAII